MNDSSTDHSNRKDRQPLGQVVAAIQSVGLTDLIVVGAAARDLWLDELGAAVERATVDSDFAFAVRDWDQFRELRRRLLATKGFVATSVMHRIRFHDRPVDLVPFGDIERPDRTIAWPDGGAVMNLIGFQEAAASAVNVLLPGTVSVKAASLPAMLVLKLCAWADRKATTRRDAADFWSLLRAYSGSMLAQDRVFGPGLSLHESYKFDPDLTSAWLLGKDARAVLGLGDQPDLSLAHVRAILISELDADGALGLVSTSSHGNLDRRLRILGAFHAGFVE